jgi:uncharacterized protein (DUF58 family)
MTMQDFVIQGTEVRVEDLLKLQTLAVDLKKLNARPSRSRRIGEQRSKYRGQGREFIEMKHYQTGDDVRQIDWRLTAKKQEPFVRVMQEDRHIEHVIWLPLSARQYFGTRVCFKSVLACHWAAFLVWRFHQLKHPVRLLIDVTPGWHREIKITSGRHAAQACKLICESHAYLAQNFNHSAEPALEAPHWSGHPNLWIISDFLDDQLPLYQRAIDSKPVATVTCLQTMDSFDERLPDVGSLPVKNQQQTAWLHTSERSLQQQYQHYFKTHIEAIKQFCWQHQGELIQHYNHSFHWKEVQSWPLYQ